MYIYKMVYYSESYEQSKEIERLVATKICNSWYCCASCMVYTFDSTLTQDDIKKIIPCECTLFITHTG